ncbi:MAG: FIST N-terminal domain-containing protein [Candidatus Omnitrophica bacterium]|nr:FIST N-terminal domain-containing protein [Candidatus Omnitrophota bacterium]
MSIQFGVGVSTQKDSLQATQEALRQAKSNLQNKQIHLAIVFSSIHFAHPAILRTISSLLGPIPVIGASSLAVISDLGIFKQGLAIALFSFTEEIYFNTACVKEINTKPITEAGRELGEKLLYGFKGMRRDFGTIFSDGLIPDGSSFIGGLQERLGISFPWVGASASDNFSFKKTYIYFNQEVLTEAACGILWGGKFNFGLGTKHGWKPLGKPHQVTRSNGNTLEEIDGAPAVNIYKEYLAYDLPELKKELKRISIFYPIGVYLPGEDEYLLRNILWIKEDGSLVFQGNVPQDSRIRLMIGTKESCLSAASSALEEVKSALMGKPIKFLFVFDSASRYMLMGRQAKRELEVIKEGLDKNTPIIGLYTYGEQAPLKAIGYHGRNYFHNQTITLLGIGG